MEPSIRSLSFSRYRAFRDPQRAELGRLNLVYGENNAGKSALVRLPALLAESRTPGRPGLALGAAAHGANFREVQWRGDLPSEEDRDLVIGVELGPGLASWSWTLRWEDGTRTAAIQRLAVKANHGSDEVEPDLARVVFDGLVPAAISDHDFGGERRDLARVLDGVVWLEAKREPPPRTGAARGARATLSGKGEGAASVVASDHKLRIAVSNWFHQHAGCGVEVQALGEELERVVLQPTGANFDVPFPDAGEGLQQAFSVVVALEHLRDKGGLLCVEEPESNLHPRLQRALAELMVDVLTKQPRAAVLVETHSEVFLLAALKAATRELRDDIRLYWVEADKTGAAILERLRLDKTGRPEGPRLEQAFEIMGAMRRELMQARRAPGDGG